MYMINDAAVHIVLIVRLELLFASCVYLDLVLAN